MKLNHIFVGASYGNLIYDDDAASPYDPAKNIIAALVHQRFVSGDGSETDTCGMTTIPAPMPLLTDFSEHTDRSYDRQAFYLRWQKKYGPLEKGPTSDDPGRLTLNFPVVGCDCSEKIAKLIFKTLSH